MGDDERGDLIGLVLAGLPADCGVLELRQVPGDPYGADLKPLDQRGRSRERITTAASGSLGGQLDTLIERFVRYRLSASFTTRT